jgi:pyroglutamyl-peptidase
VTSVLVTGFGPYPRVPRNPTDRIARALAASPRLRRLGIGVEAHVFETSYAAVRADLPGLLARTRPDACLHLGLAPRARRIRIEQQGENRARVLFADASGRVPDRRLSPGGPDHVRLVAKAVPLAVALHRRGLDVELSRDAGAYLCNALAYRSFRAARAERPARPCVFVHVPKPAGTGRRRRHTPSEGAMIRGLEDLVALLATDARRGRVNPAV